MGFFRPLITTTYLICLTLADEINVLVGGGGLLSFSHPSIPAAIGDVVVFRFGGPGPQNHSVVQSTFENPCHAVAGGFNSGYMPVTAGAQGGVSIG
jgi:hypothetical protein